MLETHFLGADQRSNSTWGWLLNHFPHNANMNLKRELKIARPSHPRFNLHRACRVFLNYHKQVDSRDACDSKRYSRQRLNRQLLPDPESKPESAW